MEAFENTYKSALIGQKKQKNLFLTNVPAKKTPVTITPRAVIIMAVFVLKSIYICDVSPVKRGSTILPGHILQKGGNIS
jgi:hypothetical protein